jgi:hypothetical protein
LVDAEAAYRVEGCKAARLRSEIFGLDGRTPVPAIVKRLEREIKARGWRPAAQV